MAMTAKLYGNFHVKAYSGDIKIIGPDSNVKVMLLKDTYTPIQTEHIYVSALTPSVTEVVGNGYLPGGKTITGTSASYDNSTKKVTFRGNNLTWSNISITARYAVLYDGRTGNNDTMPLIGYIDFGENVTTYNGDFTLEWDTIGIFSNTLE